jgi:copper transport protein
MLRPARGTRLLATVCGLLLLPSLAGAHAVPRHTSLKRSEPAKDGRLATPPTRISLWFTAKPELAFSKISLAGPTGVIPLDTIVADTAYSLHGRIPRTLPAGEYRVLWQTGGTDGHTIRGEFSFVVLARAGATPDPSAVTAFPVAVADTMSHAGHGPVPPPVRDETGYRTARWFEFVALLTVLGALGFRHGVLPPLAARGVPTADASGRARRLGQSVLVLYLTAALVRLYTQAVALNGPGGAVDPAMLTNVVTRTTWGIGWSAGVIGAVLLLIGWVISKRNVTIGTPLALTGALGLVLSPALSGHAAASRHFILSTTLDMLHIAAAGVWIGGLLMVLLAGIPAMLALAEGNRNAAVSALVNSFHPLALFCAPIAVLAGLGTSWIRLGRPSALWPTLYGRTLLVKLALVALLLAMGAYNSLRARRRLGGADAGGDATRRFRLTASGELVLAALVLVVTTFLVVTPVPSEMESP